MPINFRQLEVFCAVAEANGFTRAGQKLFISQSTVSQHIRELEESLSLALFTRNRRNVTLTPAGENLLDYGRKVFEALEEAEAAAKTIKDPYCGKLSFGCASTTLLYHLPEILSKYNGKYPNVELNINGGSIQEVAPQLWSGAVDLALVVLPLSSPVLEKIVLFEEAFVTAVPAGHPLASRRNLQVTDLAGDRFILHRPGQNTRRLIDRYLYKKRVAPRISIELAETEAIKAMVARGLGVSVLPRSAFLSARVDVKTFPIPRKDLKRALAVVYPRSRPLRPPAAALIELLQEHFRRPAVRRQK